MKADIKTGIIYCWRNVHNGKRYIGQTIHPKDRFNQHKRHLGNYDGPNLFGRALNKYSLRSDWEYTVIEEVPTSQLDTQEIYWIEFYDSMNPECGYNTCEGGHNVYGYTLPDEVRRKISEALKGNSWNKGKPAWNKGKQHTEETKKKISEANRGHSHPHDETTRKKMSEAFHKRLLDPLSPYKVAVYQNDTLISICNTTLEAGLIAGVSYHVVNRIASGRRTSKTKNGFTFKYVNKTQSA